MKSHQFLTIAALITACLSMCVTPSLGLSAQEHKFTGRGDGQNPLGNLVTDGAGNFFGTTTFGGSGFGTVFKWSRSQNGQFSESVIYNFTNREDGESPAAFLVIDPNRNLYGVSVHGPNAAPGVAWKLTPQSDGTWSEANIYVFQPGSYPVWGLTSDSAGNLYGTTGADASTGGSVFRLSQGQNGQWTLTTLHTFLSGVDGSAPNPVFVDSVGNVYGTTLRGGSMQGLCGNEQVGCGTVYELIPSITGGWTKTTLYMFGLGADGGSPLGEVSFDSSGNFFGEALDGGSFVACPNSGCGVVFEMSPEGSGNWTFSVAHTFDGLNGSLGEWPSGGLFLDQKGNFYGTTQTGGKSTACFGSGCGTIFELSPKAGGGFAFKLLFSFNGSDGWTPQGPVYLDSSGTFYGTTQGGGVLNSGVVFEATP